MPILESLITFGSFLPTLSRIAYYFSGTQTNFAKTKYYDIRAESYRAKTEKSNSNSPASENLRKAEKNYSQQKAKHEQQILKLEREKLSIEKQKLEFQQLELELQVEISAKRFELLREFQQENVDLKWQEIQINWDNNDNWFSTINRKESADILRKYANCLLILTSEPKISKDPNLDLFKGLDFELEMSNLGDFLKHSYPCRDVSHPVKHFNDYFEKPIGDIEVEQLHSILNKISTYVIYPDITTKKITFRIAFWGINGELENLPPIEWNWQETQKELIKQGKSAGESISDIRYSFVEIHKLITAFLIDSYYLYIDPLYEFTISSLEAELELKLPQELINPFKELQRQQKAEYLDYLETLREKPINASLIRERFAQYLAEIVQTMQVAENEAQLFLADEINKLKQESSRLSHSFDVSIIGFFNEKTSRIERVLDKIFNSSAGIYYSICLEAHNLNDNLNDITREITLEISNSDAIFFVMTADQPFTTRLEEQYFKEINEYDYIKAKIFYLIDKWENLEETDIQDVHNILTTKFQEFYNLDSQEEAEKLWGERLFKVHSLNAEEKLNQAKSIGRMTFIEFEERLDNFLKNERLQEQILQSVEINKQFVNKCDRLISQRLQLIKAEIEALNEVIEKTDELLTEMENNCSNIKKIIDRAIESYKSNVISSYRAIFRATKPKLERIFTSYPIDRLKKESINEYLTKLESSYQEIVSEALNSWQKQSESDLFLSVNTANLSMESSVKLYNELMKKLNSQFSIEEFQSTLCSAKIVLDMRTLGSVCIGTVGSNLLFVPFVGLNLPFRVPSLLINSPFFLAVVGVESLMDIINPAKKIEEIKKQAINKYQKELEQFTKDEKIEEIKKMIEPIAKSAFSPLMEKQKTMLSNAQSIRDSLNNQKIQLENWKINYEEEESRLIKLGKKLSIQLQEFEEEYNKYFPST
jgi:hypothetical protein